MEKLLKGQKGIGGIIILLAVAFIVLAVGAMIYFLVFGGKKTDQQKAKTTTEQSAENNNREVRADEVPLKICATGDPEQCDDPIPNSVVDQVEVDDLP